MWSQVSAQAGMKKPVDEPAGQGGQAIPGGVALFSSTRKTLQHLPAQHGSRVLAFSGADEAACACKAGVPKENQAGAQAHSFPEQRP